MVCQKQNKQKKQKPPTVRYLVKLLLICTYNYSLKVLIGLIDRVCERKENVRHSVHFKHTQEQDIIYRQYFLYIHVFVCEGKYPAGGTVSSGLFGI